MYDGEAGEYIKGYTEYLGRVEIPWRRFDYILMKLGLGIDTKAPFR
jgi:hypothetical protein